MFYFIVTANDHAAYYVCVRAYKCEYDSSLQIIFKNQKPSLVLF